MGAWRLLGPFEATLLGAIESEGPLGYQWALVIDEGKETRLFVAAETSELHEEVFLTVADGQTHGNLGAESDWTLVSSFHRQALTIARERLGVDESPQPLWGLPVTWAQFRP